LQERNTQIFEADRIFAKGGVVKIEEAVQFFGSKAEIARVLGLGGSAVWHWKKIPLMTQYQLQIASDGVLVADLPADRRADALAALK
jgi:hypothetical protein